jgi:hypothetical protein
MQLLIGLSVFAVVLLGALAGWIAGHFLPHQVTEEIKNLVTISTAVVATVSALSLGLLLSTANTAFTARGNEVTRLSADIIRLDRMLRRYGPDADAARDTLRHYAERKAADLFPEQPEDPVRVDNPTTYDLLFRVEERLLALHPADTREQWLVGQALTLATNVGNTRWLLAQQEDEGMPRAFLILLTFWLTLLFASFGLFAPRKLMSAVVLVLCALAVSGAVELIFELEDPFTRIVRISPLPLRNAVAALSQQGSAAQGFSPTQDDEDRGTEEHSSRTTPDSR